ncbi:MAG TPA: PEGA domain-containing protein [Gammaproteobacteria bacterium]|nr:PEGA domain-containing protein [Gammaproteobacteria bacterium]
MSRVYFIRDARGERRVGEADMPLSVGGDEHSDVLLPDADARVAHIALADGHAFIQPDDVSLPLFHNHERITDSTWLKSGDQVQLGESVLHWTVQGDQVSIQVRQADSEVQLKPPSQPPPVGNEPLPVVDNAMAAPAPHRLRRVFIGLFVLLLLVAAFVLLATPFQVRITPAPETQSISGFAPVLTLGGRLLALPGRYTVHAARQGYRDLEQVLDVPMGGFQEYSLILEELPGRITLHVEPGVDFELFVDDAPLAVDAAGIAEIPRGTHRLRVQAQRYLAEELSLAVEGFGKAQTAAFKLRPAWALVSIDTQPAGAELRVDGELLGITPLQVELLQGSRSIELSLAAYKPVLLQQDIVAGVPLQLHGIELQPADGSLALQSTPSGASIRINGDFMGTTPATLSLASRQPHRVQLSKPGYRDVQQSVTLEPLQARELTLELPPEYGTLFVSAQPADASLSVDGKPVGKATRRLRLTTRPHTLVFSKPGYVTKRVTVTPRSTSSRKLDIELKTLAQAKVEATPALITTAAGQRLRLVRPEGRFRMGASRREAGRRANESRRLVQLQRPFYMGEKEVTNAEFRRFRSAHRSGALDGATLDGDLQPVVKVSWDDAVRYCNWLSRKDGLPPAYREQGGKMTVIRPLNTGYRLPTEAEWVYVARVLGQTTPARYPWEGSYPPAAVAGNFADARIADTLADVVPGYDDSYRGTAPVGSFAARPPGFHDLGGNVAEWTNDYYAVYPGEAERLVTDPAGPEQGDHYVVRGSSWRHGSITELRLSYRDYSRTSRADLGFRIARYAE